MTAMSNRIISKAQHDDILAINYIKHVWKPMKKVLKKMVLPNPKFRIICRNNKFVPQEFMGIWKFGLYADIAKDFIYSNYIHDSFEHEEISQAELVIERRKKQFKHRKWIVKDYQKV